MKKLILFLGSLSLFANEAFETKKQEKQLINDHYFYGTFGVGPAPIPFPQFGLGFRNQINHGGVDINIKALSAFGVATIASYQTSALYYFNPNLKSQFYTGIGASINCGFEHFGFHNFWAAAPVWIFGKSYLNNEGNRRFFELEVKTPSILLSSGSAGKHTFFPFCTFTYGLKF
jgi:hypothetical protein